MKVIALILIFSLFFMRTYSQKKIDYNIAEKIVGTESKTEILFHEMLKDFTLKLNNPGIILGIEKICRKKLSNGFKITPKNQRELYGIDLNKYVKHGLKKTIRRAKYILNDSKIMTLTHWISFDKEYQRIQNYNLYENLETNQNLLENSISQINEIKVFLDLKIKSEQYTHIILASTGWNNDQKKSIETYNKWIEITKNAAKYKNIKFKPFIIGLTWPSAWKFASGNIISYFNKANDADEIGMTFANLLIWKALIPVLEGNSNTKLVLLGHSFGARILTRASHSKIILSENIESNRKIDFMIAAQGAFSINRFLNKKSAEGNLYTTYHPWKKFIATSSKHDRAVDNVFYTTMIGNDKAVAKLLSAKSKLNFYKNIANSKGNLLETLEAKEYTIVVADNLIYKGNTIGVKAHSDIDRPQFGIFINNILAAD
jgi:hypothetical protein